jgi:hypothetical protein
MRAYGYLYKIGSGNPGVIINGTSTNGGYYPSSQLSTNSNGSYRTTISYTDTFSITSNGTYQIGIYQDNEITSDPVTAYVSATINKVII